MNQEKESLKRLKDCLGRSGGMVISYSGGLDSTFLAVVAHEMTGGLERCVLLDSPLLPRRTLDEATSLAASLAIPCDVVPFPVLEDREFEKNPAVRCYICKKRGSEILWNKAGEYGVKDVMDGVNFSDYQEFRPGIRAADEAGIRHPLAECGLTKAMIRRIAKEQGYPFSEIPSTPCLATRLPYGEMIEPGRLEMIGRAEEFLADSGFRQVRVRMHGDLARIEVPEKEIPRLLEDRERIVRVLQGLGFLYCTVDLQGLQSGSMDRVLAPRE